ncbi:MULTISPECIES: tRNA lysidine(34) synthetase TilS [Burkholderiaceae]|uniref:tRNA lysidine(34) synthetase TilS n=1 Tax=Burkholderiaceae TaxID=119060 RepID=UPI0009606666|nr:MULTISPECIES: tRNA lysidine(34) synthetase TilS [Burkholderiaceae]MCG1018839.1 tRNA lysidine(34) synthetase TilS [Mycetohabitans sp. B4]SIT74655.1 tRNA(Ile)-lysidine synthase [Burkholderia sp. b13]
MTTADESSVERLVLGAVAAQVAALHGDESVAIAFSGGLDSTVLLHAATRVLGARRCVALHVHHGLSPHADAWRSHCADVACRLGVVFDCRAVAIARTPQHSVEALARDARYAALEQMCAAHRVRMLWLGHHADDQAETVLLQLLRGAGLPGLAAMPLHRVLPNGLIHVRPLLSVLRASLDAYARQHALRWIEDESNADPRYARNAVRRHVTPTLAVHFPGYRDALARTARHAAAAQRLLEDLAMIDLRACTFASRRAAVVTLKRSDASVPVGPTLSRRALVELSDERAVNLLRFWMRKAGLATASAARVDEILRQLREAGDDAALRIEHNEHCLRLYRNRVWWERQDDGAASHDAMPPSAELRWSGQSVWRLPAWRGAIVFVLCDADDEQGVQRSVLECAPLTVRGRRGGERMRLRAGGPLRTLKNLFQEAAVPAWRRDVPLLFVGDMLLWVPGLGVDPNVAGRGRVRIEWRPDILLA